MDRRGDTPPGAVSSLCLADGNPRRTPQYSWLGKAGNHPGADDAGTERRLGCCGVKKGLHGEERDRMSKRKPGAPGVRVVGSALAVAVRALTLPFGREVGTRIAGHASGLIAPVVAVKTPRGAIRFWCPSSTSSKYAVRFMRYEPDTRAWIENYL